MAYVVPNSILQLFKGINLDDSYMHTIYFANETAQDNWFTSKVFKSYNDLMYRRYTSDSVRIQADATELQGVTYLRFKNTRTLSKWYYAFVLSVDYVNENTALVTYEIDVMQTWFMQGGRINPCMVLREHVNDDTFGINLEIEPIGSDVYDGDYITNCDGFDNYSVVGQTTGASGIDEHVKQGVFTGCDYYHHELNSVGAGNDVYQDIQSMLGSWSVQEQEQDLIDLYLVPTFCIPNDNTPNQFKPVLLHDNIYIPSTFDNYTPKNNKLFMYPYSYLMCTTHSGDAALYRWEYFDGTQGSQCEFAGTGTFIGGGEVILYPKSYNGKLEDVDDGLIMNNFPKCSFSYDAYQAWIASGGTTRLDNDRLINSFKGASSAMSLGSQAASEIAPPVNNVSISERTQYSGFVGSTPVGSVANREYESIGQRGSSAGAITSIVSGALGITAGILEAKNNMQYTFNDAVYHANIVVGKNTSCLPVARRDLNFYFYHFHVRDDEAKRIDDFFSCYGYSVNKVKTPNLSGRAYWNFVKTQGAVIAGEMPSSSKEAIGRIFDSGITFWHNGDQVGNYAQSVSEGSINNPII